MNLYAVVEAAAALLQSLRPGDDFGKAMFQYVGDVVHRRQTSGSGI